MAVTPTYTPLGTITLASTDSEIVFSSIPATYRDLIIVMGYKTEADSVLTMRLNGDSGSNYTYVRMYGTGSGSGTSNTSTQTYLDWEAGDTAAQRNTTVGQIMDYAQTDKHKTVLLRANQTIVSAYAERWVSLAAVNTITLGCSTSSFSIGSTFSLYGVN
jgi:hypothetical protein